METTNPVPGNPLETLYTDEQSALHGKLALRGIDQIQKERAAASKVMHKRAKQAGEHSVAADLVIFNNDLSGLNPSVRLRNEVAAAEGVEPSPYLGDQETIDTLREEFDAPSEWTDPETNQKFTVRILNRGQSDNDPLFFMQPFSASPGEVDQHKNTTILRAAYLKNQTMVVVESPGLDGSDKLTKEQRKSLKKDGSSTELGRSLIDATLANYPVELNSIKATGHSMGGFLAIGLARAASERGIPVSGLVAVDTPGFRDTYNLAPIAAGVQLLTGFAGEGKALSQMPAGLDPTIRAATQEGTSPREAKALLSRMGRQKTLGFRLGKAQLANDLSVILQANPHLTISIVEAGASKVTKPAKTQTGQLLADLENRLEQAGIPHGHIDYTLLHGETHALDANPGRAAYLIEQGLKARKKATSKI